MSVARQTKYCVVCLNKKAVSWIGHVLKGQESIIAGWCKKCEYGLGFVGHYKKKMRAMKDTSL